MAQEDGQDGITRDNHYDAFGRLLSINYLTADQKNNRLLTFHYDYDYAGLLCMRIRQEAATQQAIERYRYNANGNLVDYRCLGTLCPYDERGHVITKQHYTFDSLGNIETVVGNQTTTHYRYSIALPTRLLGYQNTNPIYRNSGPWQYDDSGHVITDNQNNTYTYTPLGQTAEVTAPDGEVTLYHYDGEGRQVWVQTGQHAPLYLHYSGPQLFTQRQGTHVISMLYGAALYGSSDDHQVTRYLTDVAGSVIKRVKHGQVVSTVVYSPYGIETNISNMGSEQALAQHIGFDGQLLDSASGMQFLGQGYRGYDPRFRRFMANDLLSPFDKGGINGYVFADSNPIMQADPSGQSAEGFLPHDAFGWGALGAGIVGGFFVGSVYASLPATFLELPIAPVIGLALDVGLLVGTTYVADHFSFADMATNWQPALINLGTIVAFNGAGWGMRKLSRWISESRRWQSIKQRWNPRVSSDALARATRALTFGEDGEADLELKILRIRHQKAQDRLKIMQEAQPLAPPPGDINLYELKHADGWSSVGTWRTGIRAHFKDYPLAKNAFYEGWAARMRQKASEGFNAVAFWRSHENYYRAIDNIVEEEARDSFQQVNAQIRDVNDLLDKITSLGT